jgi:cytochrome c-type biogenesis protein CcmH/NrfG
MTKREHDLRTRFQRAVTKHRKKATGETWYALGGLLAEAYGVSRELGDELSDGLGDPITCWRRCVRLKPGHADAWHRLGHAYFELDDRPNATKALTRAVKLDPHVATAWNKLAILTLPEPGEDDPRRVRRAERYLRRAIDEDPRGKKLGWEPYAWLAEAAERRRHDPDALAWYSEATRRGDRYAAARKQVIEGHGARRRGTPRPPAKAAAPRNGAGRR